MHIRILHKYRNYYRLTCYKNNLEKKLKTKTILLFKIKKEYVKFILKVAHTQQLKLNKLTFMYVQTRR